MHSHSVSPATGRKLQLSLWITAAFIVVEFAAGIKAQSLALLSDAGHNFTDALALALAWFAFYLQSKPPNETKTFGYHRAGVLSAFLNAATLVLLALFIFYEASLRFLSPREVEEGIMIVVAAAGLVVNIGGVVIAYTGVLWIDPLLSVLIGLLILWSGWDIIRESLNILLEGLPRGMKREGICRALKEIDGVIDVHDVHAWSLSSNSHALSCHALINDLPPSASDQILRRINDVLGERFHIHHTTIQFEHVQCEHAESICSSHPVEVAAGRR